jgi:hypothetical protein
MFINLWYAIKKLGYMTIDNKCDYCRNTLRFLKEYPLKQDEAIVIVPITNCSNVITHYHIGRCNRENIKETKIYRDLINR